MKCFSCLSDNKRRSLVSIFCKFFKKFITLQKHASIFWAGEKYSFICLSTYETRSIVPIFCKQLKNIFALHKWQLQLYRDYTAFEYSLARTIERLKKLFYCPSLYKQYNGFRFLQEIEQIFILFISKRLFERFSCLSTVITLEILDFYTFFQKS